METFTKLLLGAIVICLTILIWRVASPLQLQIVGPFQSGTTSGIPIALNVDQPWGDRYDVQVATDNFGVVVVKVDKASGYLEVYRVDGDGKLRLTDSKQ